MERRDLVVAPAELGDQGRSPAVTLPLAEDALKLPKISGGCRGWPASADDFWRFAAVADRRFYGAAWQHVAGHVSFLKRFRSVAKGD